MSRFYVTSSIPYVNAHPHLGHALELVQTDVLARHRRLRGDEVRSLTGTDDHALKNSAAAEAAGVPTQAFVDANAARFAALGPVLDLSFDDQIRTSRDPRHRPGVEALWEACSRSGDLYGRQYEGRYCLGCEEFVQAERCDEHDAPLELVAEENWFFRLSRYGERLAELIASGELRIEPEQRRNEALGFVRSGLRDFSVSRSARRARGWGIPVPGDPTQVVYVWFDALANYITALRGDDDAYARWWCGDGERIHVIGKGILRFHAIYWPAILLSGGEPLPTAIFVHDYLTANGRKLSKTAGLTVDPFALAERYGTEALRWWLLADVPRVGDVDFTDARLVERHDVDLANGIGNLVNRTAALLQRPLSFDRDDALPRAIDTALARFDIPSAVGAIRGAVEDANRTIETSRPWELQGAERDAVLGPLASRCRTIATELSPFLPSASERLLARLDGAGNTPPFPRLFGVDGVRAGA